MLFGVRLYRFFRMSSGMDPMAHGCLSMMRRLLMVSRLVMLCRLFVMTGSMGVMFGSFLVMLRSLLGHCEFLVYGSGSAIDPCF